MPKYKEKLRKEKLRKEKLRILLVDADSQKGFANLALMKLSAYHKGKGHLVELLKGIPESKPIAKYDDRAYISCIFFQNGNKAKDYADALNRLGTHTEIGGSGISNEIALPDDIEHIMPDYSLYGIDFSMGFTSRGCIRKCPWCVVPKKEGAIRDNAPISEFLHPAHNKIVILDNNFLASPKWKENLDSIIENGLKVNFNQGLDIRLVNEENAKMLKEANTQAWRFNNRILSFAFDHPSHKAAVIRGIDLLKSAGFNGRALMFYVLVGFNTTLDEDLERIQFLIEQNVDPYVMRYNQKEGPNRILKHLARWVNWRIYRNCDFLDYDESDSQEAIAKTFKYPPTVWGGYSCPLGGYAWANREIEDNSHTQEELETGDDSENA